MLPSKFYQICLVHFNISMSSIDKRIVNSLVPRKTKDQDFEGCNTKINTIGVARILSGGAFFFPEKVGDLF